MRVVREINKGRTTMATTFSLAGTIIVSFDSGFAHLRIVSASISSASMFIYVECIRCNSSTLSGTGGCLIPFIDFLGRRLVWTLIWSAWNFLYRAKAKIL